jgi:ATP-dependent 26S proteasome regulatory subunit
VSIIPFPATPEAAPAEGFGDNLAHLAALEHEAKLMLAVASLRRSPREAAAGADPWGKYRQHFPFLPPNADLPLAQGLLRQAAAANREREAASWRCGVQLNFEAFAREWRLAAFERQALMLLLMQFTAPQFVDIFRKCEFEGGFRNRGMEVGTLLSILCEDFRDQVDCRRHFSVDATLMKQEIVALLGAVDETTNILNETVCLHERVVRRILGDPNRYSTASRFMRRERGDVDLDQIIMPEREKEEIVRCLERYLAGRAGGGLDEIDTFFGYGTGLVFMFHGPSGTGKTMLARALASRFDRHVISLARRERMSEHGVSDEEVVAAAFREAELQGDIVLLDECDDLFANNSPMSRSLLIELEKARCVVILGTNKPVDLDPALERRIGMKVRFRLPDAAMRLRMWTSLLPRGVALAPDVDLAALADHYLFSGGLIKNCILLAAMQAEKGDSGERILTGPLLERAAALQSTAYSDGGGLLFTQYTPKVSIANLPLRSGVKERLAGTARAWERLRADGLGLAVLISASDVTAGIDAAGALARECGLDVRQYDYAQIQAMEYENWLLDPVTQRKIPPIAFAFSQTVGASALTLFVDPVGAFRKMLDKAAKGETQYQLFSLTMRLRTYAGLFCMVTPPLKRQRLPLEFHIHFAIDYPSEEIQIRRWEEHIGGGAGSDDDLVALVERWPMHATEIDHLARQASILSVVRGGSRKPEIGDVHEVIGRYRQVKPSRVLFGGE